MADTAHTGYYRKEYAALAVQNMGDHIERAMHPLMDEIEGSMKMGDFDNSAMAEVDNLVTDLENSWYNVNLKMYNRMMT